MEGWADFLERLGDWNPQLLREIRGRVKPRTLLVAIVASVVLQILMFAAFAQVPLPPECWGEGEGFCPVTGQLLWRVQFYILSVLIPLWLYVLGGFTLVDDLSREEFRGTLSFIRIAPRSSSSIILGKILGAPILSFLGAALLLPYHILSGFGARVPLTALFSYYLLVGAGAGFIYCFGILVAFFTADLKVVPRLGNISGVPFLYGFFCLYFAIAYLGWNFFTAWPPFWTDLSIPPVGQLAWAIQWFYLPLSGNSLLAHGFTLGNGAIAITAMWWILQRRFRNPSLPLLSKFLSYPVVSYLHLMGLGFMVVGSEGWAAALPNLTRFYLVFSGDWLLFVLLILTLTPDRQALLDWARYGSSAVLRDLIWGDRSPAPLAIALNLVLTTSTTLIWVGSWEGQSLRLREAATLLTISLTLLLVLYAVAVQLIAFGYLNRARTWMLGFISVVTVLPLIVLPIFQLTPARVPFLWIFFGYAWAASSATPSAILLAIALQGGTACLLAWLLLEQMRRAKVITSSS